MLCTLCLALLAGPWEPDVPPRAFSEEVTVTAALRRAAVTNTPSAVSVLTSSELAATASGAIDDDLRQAPGFALFRRSGSRTANPTTQGATRRGRAGRHSSPSRTRSMRTRRSGGRPWSR